MSENVGASTSRNPRGLHGLYRDNFTLLQWFHGSTLHGDRCAAFHNVHTNFADESACLKANNVRNEVVTIYRSHEILKILSLYM
jgi:hypothetical protein